MRKIVITFGLIAGAIESASMLGSVPLWKNGYIDPSNGQLLGYTTMVIALSMIFVAVKSYRDQYQNGAITFGKAFKIGLYISLIAGVMYAITWEFTFNFLMPNFMEDMKQFYIDQKTKSGGTAEQIAATRQQMEQMMAWYKNPLLRFAFTIIEILPVGLIISIISAALLRKKEILPA